MKGVSTVANSWTCGDGGVSHGRAMATVTAQAVAGLHEVRHRLSPLLGGGEIEEELLEVEVLGRDLVDDDPAGGGRPTDGPRWWCRAR